MAHRLVDPGGGKFLPFAESQLSTLRRVLGGADFARVLKVDGYTISIRRSGGEEFITILDAPQVFEFYTSGVPVTTYDVTQGAFTFKSYDVGVVSAKVQGERPKARFVGNTKLSLAPNKPGAETYDRHGWQVQLGQTPHVDVVEVGKGKRRFEYTISHVNLPTTGHTFAHVLTPFWSGYEGHAMDWTSTTAPAPLPWSFATRDVGYDVLNWRMPGDSPEKIDKALAPSSDWPRFWGIQEVKKDGTAFQYGVYVDASGSWYAFPLGAMGEVSLDVGSAPVPNLLATNHKKVTPTYPAWVWRGDSATTKLKDQGADHIAIGAKNPEFRWEFNHLGTRACTVAYARADFGAFETGWYTALYPSGPAPMTLGEYESYCQYNNPWPVPTGMAPFAGGFGNAYEGLGLARHFAGPGVIEATLTITKLEGADPEDFDFTVVIGSIVNPTSDVANLPLAAGYLWHKVEGANAAPGDMLVLEVEVHSDVGGEGEEHFLSKALRVRNASTTGAVFSNMRGWVRGLDFRTLSFHMQGLMTTTNGPSRTVARGSYFPGETVPAWYEGEYTDTFITARPYNYVVVKGKLEKVLVPPDIPAELAALAAAIQARTTDDMVNVPYSVPDTAVKITTSTRWTPAAMRAEWAPSSTTNPLRTKATMWFGEGVNFALVWAAAPNGLDGYPAGWLMAVRESLNYLRLPMVDSTFYVHPNGSWAVFDTNTFYNTLGVPKPDSTVGRWCNTGTLLSASQFKWFAVDVVCIKRGKKKVETTFVELYNQAQTEHAAVAEETNTPKQFDPLLIQQVLPTFSLHTQSVENYTTPSSLSTTEYTLGITWKDGSVLYRRLPSYHSGGMLFPDSTILNRHQAWPGWCLLGDANDMMFSNAACTTIYPDGGMSERYTFRVSSPRLIAAPKG
jgi:hypothetical protein